MNAQNRTKYSLLSLLTQHYGEFELLEYENLSPEKLKEEIKNLNSAIKRILSTKVTGIGMKLRDVMTDDDEYKLIVDSAHFAHSQK